MRTLMMVVASVGAAAVVAQSAGSADAAMRSIASTTRIVTSVPRVRAAKVTPSFIDPHSRAALATGALAVVYVSQLLNGTVLAYPTSTPAAPKAPVEVISGLHFPQGLAVDTRGNVYVGELNDVKVFGPGSTTPMRTLTGVANVGNVAVDGQGTVYVLASQGPTARIFVYRNGATAPSYTLTDPAIDIVTDLAVDAAGNIFIVYLGTDFVARVGAFTSLGPLLVPLQVGAGILPFTLALDNAGNLLVDAATANPAIAIFGPATQTARASVQVATSANGRALFAVSAGDHHLYVAPQYDGVIREYGYPAGGLQQQIQLPPFLAVNGPIADFTTGIAVSPPSPVGSW